MDFQVRSFVSSVLEEAVDDFVDDVLVDAPDEAAVVDFFPEDFDDEKELSELSEPEPRELVRPVKSNFFQYVCRLLDGALSGEAQVFEKPGPCLAAQSYARSRVQAARKLLCPYQDLARPSLLPLDCLPLSAPLAFSVPQSIVLSVPRPPAMPRVKQPRRRPFTKSLVSIDAKAIADTEAPPRPSDRMAASAMALDLGIEKAEEMGKATVNFKGSGFLPRIDLSPKSAGGADVVAGWRVDTWRLKAS
ncbi:unnamed protein product [Effrenium voratum]|uniref:Uncharacterized protein n=1 Tax=Effrenium voratum TaxID=2562239 RepID=A0AA36JJK6_9DINO|nr:unnamed protein product [Effrenium voratum]